MTRQSQRNFEETRQLTAVVATVNDQLDKLYWNLQQYLKSRNDSFGVGINVGFAALDYAKAASALQDWIATRYGPALSRNLIKPILGEKSADEMIKRISWQHAVRAMANAAKHGTFNDKHWPGGNAQIALIRRSVPEDRGDRSASDFLTHWDTALKELESGQAHWEVELINSNGTRAPASDAFYANYNAWELLVVQLGL